MPPTPASRTGAPAPPPEATAVFGDALGAAVRYAALLAGPGTERGLLGPRETPRLWFRHLLNCAVAADALGGRPVSSVVDLGSGAGLPGIVLALVRPDLDVILVDATRRRTEFLRETVDALGLSRRVTVEWARVEQLAGVLEADAVVARAVAPLGRLAQWAAPLLASGGRLLAIKGNTAADEVEASRAVLARAGFGPAEVLTCGVGRVDPPAIVVRASLTRARPTTQPTERRKRGR